MTTFKPNDRVRYVGPTRKDHNGISLDRRPGIVITSANELGQHRVLFNAMAGKSLAVDAADLERQEPRS